MTLTNPRSKRHQAKYLRAHGRTSSFESLENRRMLAFTAPAILTAEDVGHLQTATEINAGGYRAVMAQSTGKIVVAGTAKGPQDDDFYLARYLADGTGDFVLDSSFGDDGVVLTNFTVGSGPRPDVLHGAAIDSQDRIVAVGQLPFAGWSPDVIVRYTPDGQLDTSFSGDGYAEPGNVFTSEREIGWSVAFDSNDGPIIAAPSDYHGSEFRMIRFDDAGNFDNQFGVVSTAVRDGIRIGPKPVHIAVYPASDPQHGGKIVLTGSTTGDMFDPTVGQSITRNDWTVLRYNGDGSLDTSFDGDGIAIQRVYDSNDPAYIWPSDGSKAENSLAQGVLIEDDGKLVVTGFTAEGMTITRYNADGSYDPTFNPTGNQPGRVGVYLEALGHVDHGDLIAFELGTSLAVDADGNYVVGGSWIYCGGDNDSNTQCDDTSGDLDRFAFARFLPDGSMDTSFGDTGNGTFLTNLIGNGGSRLAGLTFSNAGEIWAAGRDADLKSILFRFDPPSAGQTEVVVFEDSFENGEWNGRWVEDSQNDWFTSTQRATEGSYSAEVDGRANDATLTMSTPLDLSSFQSAVLTFDWLIESRFDRDEYVSLDVSMDGGLTWQQDIRRLDGNHDTENVWHAEIVDLTPFRSNNTLVRFRAQASRSNEDANVDAVRIVGSLPAGPPNVPPVADGGGPYEVDEGNLVVLDGDASGDSDGTVVNYQWDFDNDGQYDDATGVYPSFVSHEDGVHIIGLRVTDDAGDTSTDTTTVTVINVAPIADAGGPYSAETNVDLTLTAAASHDPGNDIVGYEWDLDDDGQYDDATGVTANFQSTVAGDFTVHVRVTDDDGGSTTDSAIVTISEAGPPPLDDTALVAHWTVDNTTVDSASFGSVADDGSLIGDAEFVDDVTRGQVIELDGSGDRLDVADSTDLNKTMVTQRTISLWFNADEVHTRQVLFEEGGGTRGLSIYLDAGLLYVGGWNKPSGQSGWGGTFLSTEVTAGQWHNVVLTLHGSTTVQANAFQGYLDGAIFGSGDGSQIWNHSGDVGIGMMDDSTVFHDGNAGGDGFGFAGRMDDIRIYDRVFSVDEVEDLWLND